MSRKLKLIRGCATAGLMVLLWCVIPLGWSLDVQRPGPGWTEAYRSAELVIFTKDVEKGRRIVAIAEVEVLGRRRFSMSSMTSTIIRSLCRT